MERVTFFRRVPSSDQPLIIGERKEINQLYLIRLTRFLDINEEVVSKQGARLNCAAT